MLRGSGSTVVTMTMQQSQWELGRCRFWSPIDLKPLKILKPKLDRMITSWAPLTLPIFVEIGPRWSAPHIA